MTEASSLATSLAAHGLAATGGLVPGDGDGVPEGTAWLVLVGADGARLWEVFRGSPEIADGAPDPLDRWSRRVLGRVAAALGGQAIFPFGGPPYAPFIRWAERGEGMRPSPVGLPVSPSRGLWASFRGAIALPSRPTGAECLPPSEPCLGCPAPCLAACPVGALSASPYDPAACAAHASAAEGAACRDGCLVRAACPVGAAPPLGQRRFHMAAFLAARAPSGQGDKQGS